MKTTQLIELQKAITQGEWKAQNYRVIQAGHMEAWQLTIAILPTELDPRPTIDSAARSIVQRDANAIAISLVPSLLREVVALRQALQSALERLEHLDGADLRPSHQASVTDGINDARSLLSNHN